MKHPVPATMEEMPEWHTWAGQIMVSLDILCVSIDLRVYFLCPVIIQFHPLPPQWRGCHKCTNEESSSIHYRHNGGLMPERLTWAGQIMVSLDIFCVFPSISEYTSYVLLSSSSIHYRHNGGDARKAHVVPSITGRCQKGTREASSSIHFRHNGGDARKAHVGRSNYGESRYFVCFHRSQSVLLMSCYHPVPSFTATMEEMPERHT